MPANLIGLEYIVGQESAVTRLKTIIKAGNSRAILLHGKTGTGKSLSALSCAQAVGCDLSHTACPGWGGYLCIEAGAQSADAVRGLEVFMRQIPFTGSGWRVVQVDEADELSKQCEAVWLGLLEKLPPKVLVIFTTNNPEKLSQRFKDRCACIEFVATADLYSKAAIEAIAAREWSRLAPGRSVLAKAMARINDAAVIDGQVSYRRAASAAEEEALIMLAEPSKPDFSWCKGA
jgi:DNA polymerase III delta prime subunit